MTTFSPDFSPRYKWDYSVAGFKHSNVVRLPRGSGWTLLSQLSVVAAINSLLTALSPSTYSDYAILGASVCDQDSSVFTPTVNVPTAAPGTADPALVSPYRRVTAITFRGRGGLSPVHLEMFGMTFNDSVSAAPAGNGNITSAESTAIAAAVAALNAAPFTSTSGSLPAIWKPNATYKVNDFWLKKIRKTFP